MADAITLTEVEQTLGSLSLQDTDEKMVPLSAGDMWWEKTLSIHTLVTPKLCPEEQALFQRFMECCVTLIYKDDFARDKTTILAALTFPRESEDSYHIARHPMESDHPFYIALASLLIYGRGVHVALVASTQCLGALWLHKICTYVTQLVNQERLLVKNRKFIAVTQADVPSDTPRGKLISEKLWNSVRVYATNTDLHVDQFRQADLLILDDITETFLRDYMVAERKEKKIVISLARLRDNELRDNEFYR